MTESPMREIGVGEVARRISTWLWQHGGPEAMITVAPETNDPTLETANLVDSLSAYIHGQFLEEYGHSARQPWDFEGHPVVIDA